MTDIIEYFLGCVRMSCKKEFSSRVLSYMQKKGIFFKDLTDDQESIFFTVLKKDSKDKGIAAYVEVIQQRGFLHDLKKSMSRPGLYVGAVIFAVALIVSSGVIWEVRVSPRGDENTERVLEVMREAGIYSGAAKSRIDKKYAENLIMLKCPDISYASVNIVGNIARVVTDERVVPPADDRTNLYDLCASEDGYIVRVETYAGRAVCERGQTVKRGDVLISGTYDTFHHGTVTEKAAGKVYALVTRGFVCECPDTTEEKIYDGRQKSRVTFSLFSYQANGANITPADNTDVFEEEENVTLFGVISLPVKIKHITEKSYVIRKRYITSDEAEKLLSEEYEKKYAELTEKTQVQNSEREFYYEDGRYVMSCKISTVCNIAVPGQQQ